MNPSTSNEGVRGPRFDRYTDHKNALSRARGFTRTTSSGVKTAIRRGWSRPGRHPLPFATAREFGLALPAAARPAQRELLLRADFGCKRGEHKAARLVDRVALGALSANVIARPEGVVKRQRETRVAVGVSALHEDHLRSLAARAMVLASEQIQRSTRSVSLTGHDKRHSGCRGPVEVPRRGRRGAVANRHLREPKWWAIPPAGVPDRQHHDVIAK